MLVCSNRSNRSNTYNVQENTGIFQRDIALAALTAPGAARSYGNRNQFAYYATGLSRAWE
jgi:hypothetical protein